METQFYIDGERDINLRGLFFSILLKWRSILMCMVVFAVIAGGFSYMKSAKLAEKNRALIEEEQSTLSAQEREEAAKAREEAAAKALNATEITNVKHVAGVVNEYQQMYDAQKRYNDNSIYMRLDPTAVHTATLQYYVDNHFKIEYPVMGEANNVSAIVQAYQSKLSSEELYEQIVSAYGGEVEASYFKEVIDTDITGAGNGVLKIVLYGYDDAMVHTMAECIKGVVGAAQGEIASNFTRHDISLVNESYLVQADSHIFTEQQNNIQRLTTLNDSIIRLESTLSENELAYLLTLLDSQTVKVNMEEDETEETEETEESLLNDEIVVIPASVNASFVFLGFVLGAMIVVVFYGIQYIVDNRLKTEEEIEDYFKIQNMGCLNMQEKGERSNLIDKWIIGWRDRNKRSFSQEESLRMIQAGIRIAAEKHGLHNVFMTGCDVGKMEEEAIEKIKTLLSDVNLTIRYGNNPIYDPESLMELANTEGIVLIEKVGESTYSEIKKEIELCCIHKSRIVGAIVIK